MAAKKVAKKVTNKNTGRRSSKAKRVFQKTIQLDITGTSKVDIQKVAHAIHSINIDEVVGGKEERTVHVTHISSEPKQIFYGRI